MAFILRLFGCDSPPLWLRSSPSSPSSSSSTSSLPIRCSLPRRHFKLRQPLACTWDVAASARLLSCSNNYRESQFSAILQQTGSLRRTSRHAHSACLSWHFLLRCGVSGSFTDSGHGILQHISFHCAPFSPTWQSGHCAVFTVDVQCHFDRGAVIAQPRWRYRWLCTSVLPIPADSVYLSTVTVAHLFIAARVLSALALGHCPIRRYMGCA